ncbi:hypothetical protein OFR22_08630 [Brachyspira hyodysenteriae]|uniref:hypothetical protein n=1 Tax=Brachyspira hyodysenteriae TaxID=159 RepID=UPI0022CD7A26|nr:hypothetical protein [Brachyspira hyodysenteriae]MCZ9850786.1 hypothetical protein [Brachyspira hyodysenteriae]MCZ9860461.1 hypothetical protein [Brachyspira hyodysenteriae]MCZ9870038.1 hypothetical protein [Brachyspira hyodysenteriae]MCZ9875537.1 hypothetical protein [Brachyspira hyodysenteriae]MCZ9879733.1 hypothetical protein [Brachyspira hyodysenteriae]
MNKKIFTLFLVVAASAIFAVSCNNKTTNPVKDSNTGSSASSQNVADSQIETALKKLGELTVNTQSEKADASTGKYSKGVFTITKSGASNNGANNSAKSSVEAKLAEVKKELEKIGVICSDSTVTFKNSAADSSCTLNIKAKDGYKLPDGTDKTITVKITLEGKTWS